METKDWLYTIGILLSFIVGGVNLYITIENRRNALREHLYKEQIGFYRKYLQLATDLIFNFNQLRKSNYQKTELKMKLRSDITDLEVYFMHNAILLPETILIKLRNVAEEALNLEEKIHNGETQFDTDSFYDTIGEMIDAIRTHIGIDKLSEENIKLIGKSKD